MCVCGGGGKGMLQYIAVIYKTILDVILYMSCVTKEQGTIPRTPAATSPLQVPESSPGK
jgi:hypothetical protein